MAGYINEYTPLNGYILDNKGYANLSMSMISASQHHINQTETTTDTNPMVPLHPAPSRSPPIPHIINNNPSQYGAVFRTQGSHTPHQPTDNSVGYILAVSINGHSYNGSIFDANGTQLY